MPFDPGPSMPIPDSALAATAADADAMMGDALSELVPRPMKPYNAKVVDALGKALADVLALFDMAVEPETYNQPVEALDPDLVRFLAMVSAAADDYGRPLPIRLEELRDEASLTRVTAALVELARDDEFKAFLDGPEEPVSETEVAVEVTAPGMQMVEEVDEEQFDFSRRMRR